MNDYFIIQGDVQSGPYSETKIREKLKAKVLTASDLIWWEGSADWVPVSTVSAFEPPACNYIAKRKIWFIGGTLAALLAIAILANSGFPKKGNKPPSEPTLAERVIILELYDLKDKIIIMQDGLEALRIGSQFPSGPHFAKMSYDTAMAEVKSIQARVNRSVETQTSAVALLAEISEDILIWDGHPEIKAQIKKLSEIKQKDLEDASGLRTAASRVGSILNYYVVTTTKH